ncbi:putative family 2 glycosyl transferase [Magnetofaba australis IT-1]|uniref:Putative family 2 glycosyl transferase n=1 Tax=Magnetofaba australis IT-1 TaxID=1434232 RepID=A0A1Y2K8V5_9PROT|nr:putative family 2 glycosyl transferase [Magnetofaba australis IT-1]
MLMPAYNAAATLEAAVASILTQSFGDFELLVVNDGSSDDTGALLDELARRDGRIRVIHQHNQGVVRSLNTLLEQARAPLLARMDADDQCDSERFAKQIAYLQAHPQTGMVATGVLEIAPNGLPFRSVCHPDDPALLASMLAAGRNPVAHGSVMLRRSVLAQLEEPRYRLAAASEDRDLWARLAAISAVGMLCEPLYLLRRGGGSVSFRAAQVRERYLGEVGETEEQIQRIEADLSAAITDADPTAGAQGYDLYLNGKAFYAHGRYGEARACFSALLGDPRWRKRGAAFLALAWLGPLGRGALRGYQRLFSAKARLGCPGLGY